MASPQTRNQGVPKMFEDRVEADAETVSHVLNPDRTTDKVFYQDPRAPLTDGQSAPDSMGDVEMARRTDAGPSEVEESRRDSSPALWIALGIGVVLVIAFIAFM